MSLKEEGRWRSTMSHKEWLSQKNTQLSFFFYKKALFYIHFLSSIIPPSFHFIGGILRFMWRDKAMRDIVYLGGCVLIPRENSSKHKWQNIKGRLYNFTRKWNVHMYVGRYTIIIRTYIRNRYIYYGWWFGPDNRVLRYPGNRVPEENRRKSY